MSRDAVIEKARAWRLSRPEFKFPVSVDEIDEDLADFALSQEWRDLQIVLVYEAALESERGRVRDAILKLMANSQTTTELDFVGKCAAKDTLDILLEELELESNEKEKEAVVA